MTFVYALPDKNSVWAEIGIKSSVKYLGDRDTVTCDGNDARS